MNLKNIDNKHFVGIYEKAIDKHYSFEQKIEIAKAAGFDFIELSVDESEEFAAHLNWSNKQINLIKRKLDKEKFYINSMCLSLHRKYPFGSASAQTRQKALAIMEKALILAKKLGIRIIQLATYDVYYNPWHEKAEEYFIQSLKKAAKLAQKYSITLAFETMDTPFASTISRCLYLIKKVSMPNLFVYPDLGNLNRFSNDVENEIKLGQDQIVAFHFKDTLENTFKNVDFGKGDVDFVRSLKAIKSIDYQGPFLIEMWYKEKDFDSSKTLEQNKEAQVKNILKAREFFLDKLRKAYDA